MSHSSESHELSFEIYEQRYLEYVSRFEPLALDRLITSLKELDELSAPEARLAIRDAMMIVMIREHGVGNAIAMIQDEWQYLSGRFGVEFVGEVCLVGAMTNGEELLSAIFREMPRIRSEYILRHLQNAMIGIDGKFATVAQVMIEHHDAEPLRLFRTVEDLLVARQVNRQAVSLNVLPSWQRKSLVEAMARYLLDEDTLESKLGLAMAFPHGHDRWLMVRSLIDGVSEGELLPMLEKIREIEGWNFQSDLLRELLEKISLSGAGRAGLAFVREQLPNVFGTGATRIYQGVRDGALARGDYLLAGEATDVLKTLGDRSEMVVLPESPVPVGLLASIIDHSFGSGGYASILENATYLTDAEIQSIVDDDKYSANTRGIFWAFKQELNEATDLADIIGMLETLPDSFQKNGARSLGVRLAESKSAAEIAILLTSSSPTEVNGSSHDFGFELGLALGRNDHGVAALNAVIQRGEPSMGGINQTVVESVFAEILDSSVGSAEQWLASNLTAGQWQQPLIEQLAIKLLQAPVPERALDWISIVDEDEVRDQLLNELRVVLETSSL